MVYVGIPTETMDSLPHVHLHLLMEEKVVQGKTVPVLTTSQVLSNHEDGSMQLLNTPFQILFSNCIQHITIIIVMVNESCAAHHCYVCAYAAGM